MEKIGLVLEGGGIRGAYTAGAVKWLNDNNITFDYGVGISSGSVYLPSIGKGKQRLPTIWQQNTLSHQISLVLKALLKRKVIFVGI